MKHGVDLTKVLTREHEEKWVVLTKDYKKVVDSSDRLVDLTKRHNPDEFVFLHVPTSGISYAF